MSKYYVYEFWDSALAIPFYVGKGVGSRCFSKYRNDAVNKKIDELDGNYEVRIVFRTNDERLALEKERHLIQKYGSVAHKTGTLLNIVSVVKAQKQEEQEPVMPKSRNIRVSSEEDFEAVWGISPETAYKYFRRVYGSDENGVTLMQFFDQNHSHRS